MKSLAKHILNTNSFMYVARFQNGGQEFYFTDGLDFFRT